MVCRLGYLGAYYEGIDVLRDDHLEEEPMDPNISVYRFVNVPTYAYNYQTTIKEQVSE